MPEMSGSIGRCRPLPGCPGILLVAQIAVAITPKPPPGDLVSQKLIICAAWACVAAFAFATLTHVEFAYAIYYRLAPLLMWPKARTYGLFEHVIAFAVFGALFSLAYPRRIVFVCIVVFVTAVGLEYLQTLTPDRHGTLFDASEKVVGGAFGIAVAQAFRYLRGWNRKHAAQNQP